MKVADATRFHNTTLQPRSFRTRCEQDIQLAHGSSIFVVLWISVFVVLQHVQMHQQRANERILERPHAQPRELQHGCVPFLQKCIILSTFRLAGLNTLLGHFTSSGDQLPPDHGSLCTKMGIHSMRASCVCGTRLDEILPENVFQLAIELRVCQIPVKG